MTGALKCLCGVLTGFLLGGAAAWAQEIGAEEIFFRANQAYREGDFETARNGYARLTAAGHASGHLFYNLGNAAFRRNDFGRAVLNYERARRLMPRDADLRYNLETARDQVRDDIPESPGVADMLFFWLQAVTLEETFWVFVALNGLLWGLLLLRLFHKGDALYYLLMVAFVFWGIGGASLAIQTYRVAAEDRAVILAPEADVLAGPHEGETVLFKLHAGSVVRQEHGEEGWALIRLAPDKRGWVRGEEVEMVRR